QRSPFRVTQDKPKELEVMTINSIRRIAVVGSRVSALAAVLVVGVFAVCLGVAGAAPLGTIVEYSAPGTDPAQVQSGPDGNLWFSDRNGSVGRATIAGVVTRFTVGLNLGSAVRSIAMGPE